MARFVILLGKGVLGIALAVVAWVLIARAVAWIVAG